MIRSGHVGLGGLRRIKTTTSNLHGLERESHAAGAVPTSNSLTRALASAPPTHGQLHSGRAFSRVRQFLALYQTSISDYHARPKNEDHRSCKQRALQVSEIEALFHKPCAFPMFEKTS